MPTILLIEDDPLQRLIPALSLEEAGYRVIQADSGEQGLAMARAHKPDLIVCDVLMPVMNGFQFVAAVRADLPLSDIPIIMLTAMAERAHVRTGMTTGADDYLTKPLDVRELRDSVASLLARRKARQEKLMDVLESELVAALDQQKQSIGSHYEQRLLVELNTRWVRDGAADSELHYENATLLVVDLLGSVAMSAASPDLAQEVRRRYHNTRDTLYLFGARHLLPYGDDLLAIYAASPDERGTSPSLRAARAAFALVKSAGKPEPGQRAMTVALHAGPVTLVHVTDPLHGDPDSTLATGDAIGMVGSLSKFARTLDWRIAATTNFAEFLADAGVYGRHEAMNANAESTVYAVELTALAQDD